MACQEISVKQGVTMIAMYLLGTTFLVSSGIEAQQDIWVAYFVSLAASIPLVWMYARMMNHMPGKDFFGILNSLLGKPLATVFLILMTIYLFQHLSYVMRHFSEYIFVAGMPGSPVMSSMLTMGFLCALGVLYGIEVLGKWSEWALIMVASFILLTAMLLIGKMNIDYLRPTLEHGLGPVAKGTLSLVSFPFGQIVAFLFVLPPMKSKKKAYKIFIIGLITGFVLIFISSISNVLVQGVKGVARLFYPTFSTLAIIRIGNFIQRLEIVATTIFMVTVFLKAAVLLMGILKSLSSIFNLDRYGFLVFPVMLLTINYGYNAYSGNLEHYYGIAIFVPYFTTFYQIIVPFVFFVLLEWRAARQKRKYGPQVLSGGTAAGAADDTG